MAAAIGSSPSWSALFRAPNRNRRRESLDSPEARAAPTVHRSISNSPFLGPPSWLFHNRHHQQAAPATFVPTSPQHPVRTPFLTLALLKLHGALPEFCKILANNPHTQENASKACALLDTSVATSSSPAAAHASSAAAKEPKPKVAARSRARSQSPVRLQKAKNQEANSTTINASFLNKRKPALWSSPRRDSLSSTRRHSTFAASPAAPLLQWFTSSSSNHQVGKPAQHPSAVALESEWDYLVAPFYLLCAALVFEADMQHCQPSSKSIHILLPALYQRIATELLQVKETLCAPLLGMQYGSQAHEASKDDVSPLRRSANAANSLSAWLQSLATYCTLRAQLVELQASMFAVVAAAANTRESTSLSEPSQLVSVLIQSISDQATTEDAIQPLHAVFLKECEVWKYSLEACSALQCCQFCDTILRLYKWKTANYKASDTTRVSVFFQAAYRNVIAMLPLYFDRILAFAGPTYGFDVKQLMQGMTAKNLDEDWNAEVLEFLRRQERGGGPSTAVAIVLDAVRTNNLHFERGMQLTRTISEEDRRQELQSIRLCWPAVYVRSTLYLGSPAIRAQSRSDRDSGAASSTSQSSLLPTWRKSEHFSPNVLASTSRKVPVETIHSPSLIEYDGSWPHSEWEKLIALISPDALTNNMATLNRISLEVIPDTASTAPSRGVVSFRVEAEASRSAQIDNGMTRRAGNSFDVGGYNVSPKSPFLRKSAGAGVSPRAITPSTFHVTPLSEFVSLVVIVKGEEESRWHRRRNPLAVEEIRAFLDSMASKLRVSEQFGPSCIPRKSQAKVRLDAFWPAANTVNAKGVSPKVWSDLTLESLLKAVKNDFGLRPTQEGGTILSRNSPGNRGLSFSPVRAPFAGSRRASLSSMPDKSVSTAKSAAVFFMGPELATIVDP